MTEYFASWSGGKDSTASIILAHEHGEPLDGIVFAEVMFDKDISGELPEHIDFIHKCKEQFEAWGYPVYILRSEKTYLDCFYHVIVKGKHKGERAGFPMVGKCVVNRECKLRPIERFKKEHADSVWYVGIAIDEPKRLERLTDSTVSLLAKYNMTEADAFELCEIYGMLSPVYGYANRGGCWFCPNARDKELRYLRSNHAELWQRLLTLEDEATDFVAKKWNTLTQTSIHDKEEQFTWEDRQTRLDLSKYMTERSKDE